jgi:hypothetical protein
MNRNWSEVQVSGKLNIYFDQMARSAGTRHETLRELAGDLIDKYAPIYPGIAEYRERLRAR